MREESIERAIITSVRANLAHIGDRRRIALRGYHHLRAKPDRHAARLGWYLPGAKLDTHRDGRSDWFRVKLPSGKYAYLKGGNLSVASR